MHWVCRQISTWCSKSWNLYINPRSVSLHHVQAKLQASEESFPFSCTEQPKASQSLHKWSGFLLLVFAAYADPSFVVICLVLAVILMRCPPHFICNPLFPRNRIPRVSLGFSRSWVLVGSPCSVICFCLIFCFGEFHSVIFNRVILF